VLVETLFSFEERQTSTYRRSFVAIEKRLRLPDVKSVSRGDVEQITAPVE
jgi:hypothetical protein